MARTKHTTSRSEDEEAKKRKKSHPSLEGISKKKIKATRSKRSKKRGLSKINIRANKEIREQQKRTSLIIPKQAFVRLTKRLIDDFSEKKDHGIRISSTAKELLQQSIEGIVIETVQNSLVGKDLVTTRQRLETRDFICPMLSNQSLNASFAPFIQQHAEEIKQRKEKSLIERVEASMQKKIAVAEERQKKKEEKEKRKQEKEGRETEREKEKDKQKKKDKDKQKKKKRSKEASDDESELASKKKKKKDKSKKKKFSE